MSRLEQILKLDPSQEIRFKGPFTDVVTSELKLHNPSESRVCFKVKTTAPKRYCVRPNSGIIDALQTVNVAVMLQPFDYDPTEKNKHKFMVQTMFAPDEQVDSQEALWKEATPDKLMDSKLKCCFEMSVEDQTNTTQQNNLDNSNLNVLEENVKVSNVPVKPAASSEKVHFTSPKVNNVESELKQSQNECRKLDTDMKQLIEENRKLKDEGIRLRKVAISDTVSHTPIPAPAANALDDSQLSLPQIAYIVIAILMGLILGKFIL